MPVGLILLLLLVAAYRTQFGNGGQDDQRRGFLQGALSPARVTVRHLARAVIGTYVAAVLVVAALIHLQLQWSATSFGVLADASVSVHSAASLLILCGFASMQLLPPAQEALAGQSWGRTPRIVRVIVHAP